MGKKSSKKRRRERLQQQEQQQQTQQQPSSGSGGPAKHARAPLEASSQQHVQEVTTFGSRKRALEKIQFVYPRTNGQTLAIFRFGETKHTARIETTTLKDPLPDQSQEKVVARPESKESLQDILNRKKRPGEQVHVDDDTDHGDNDGPVTDDYIYMNGSAESHKRPQEEAVNGDNLTKATISGHLSGMSVEEAIRDKVGCRPRANSTDGELKLPQRGLCDERTVLENYKWRSSLISRSTGGSSRPKGLLNLGNTCFLNSTLQCLAYLPPFCQSLMDMPCDDNDSASNNNRPRNPGKKITIMLRNLFRQVHATDNPSSKHHHQHINNVTSTICPRSIVKAVPTLSACGTINRTGGYKFRPGRQEDAHEFLVHLLDAMNHGELREAGIHQNVSGWRDRLPIPRLDETTFVHRVFGGYLRSQVKCTSCGYCSNTYDPFLDLSLEVSHKSCHSVANAFHEYTRMETLDAHNKWKCSGCKKRVCAQKQLTVFRPPLSLCLQLKRFTYTGMGLGGFRLGLGSGGWGGGSGKKIAKPIQFPASMKLPLSDGRSCAYTLNGIVIHVGGSASSGHYTAYVKKPGEEKWYNMDDSFVQPVSERTVLQQRDAYLLFYSRQEVKLEFPTPPLKSMSTHQALELGRIRDRARSESFSEMNGVNMNGVNNKQQLQRRASAPDVPVRSEASSSTSSSSTTVSHEEDQTNGEAGKGVLPQNHRDFIGPQLRAKASSSAELSSSSSSSSSSESDDSEDDQGGDSTMAVIRTPGAKSSSSPDKGDDKEDRVNMNGVNNNIKQLLQRRASAPDLTVKSQSSSSTTSTTTVSHEEDKTNGDAGKALPPNHRDFIGPQPKAKSSSSSSESDDSEVQQGGISTMAVIRSPDAKSSSSPDDSDDNDDRKAKILKQKHTSSSSSDDDNSSSTDTESSDDDSSGSEGGDSGGDDTKNPERKRLSFGSVADDELKPPAEVSKAAAPANTRTKIVLDRGAGRGKVEVMLGPRHKRKAWKPKSSSMTSSSRTEEYGLLGNHSVDRWADEDVETTNAAPRPDRSKMVKQLENKASSRKRKMFLDRWDNMLDQGKKKKVKTNKAETVRAQDDKDNAFQRIQSGIQSLNRGRAKGFLRQQKQNSGKDWRR